MARKSDSAKAKGRTTLTRADVVAATQRLLDHDGADALSMRILARELSVSVSTLYWHVRDKRELLKLMIDDSLSAVRIPDAGDWKQRLAEFLRQGRNVLRARPALIGLIWGSGWELGPQTLRVTNDVVGLVGESGIPEGEVADAYFMVVAFLFGFVAMETLSPDTPGFAMTADASADTVPVPHLARYRPAADLKGMERRFERGIARIVSSLARPPDATVSGRRPATRKQRVSRPRRPATTSGRRRR
jgi:TetR/AcrR family transcriptional regulator, tetracycline repressor protein